jgi:hypothetical protein
VSPRASRLVPLRVLIGVLFVTLLALAGLAIVGYGYVATSRLLLEAGEETFEHVAERTADRLRALPASADMLSGLLARHRLAFTASVEDRLASVPFLATVLAEQPAVSAVYVGYETGDFFLLRPIRDPGIADRLGAPLGAAFLIQSRRAADPASGRFRWLDDQLAVLRDEPRPAYRFDPRTRDWYRQARGRPTPIRTEPYLFFTTREVGLTMARGSPGGYSVVGLDVTLHELSHGLRGTSLTRSARVALVDRQGRVVAHPDLERLVAREPRDAGLLSLDRLGGPTAAGSPWTSRAAAGWA